ncbi:MAG: protein kinase [Sulfuriferula multivorans]|uniref:non-specific serine/threonine protein kinase n=1 Tax=Sulfuriferula multivorans TaxID=1559896 RepID=A0A7C9K9D2_9PROT|nr:protein kinase [Sulfuriferula multivorans]
MKIGRYEVLDEIGHGAMGTVWRARDPLIERTVAIKTVAIAKLRQDDADAETRFLREAQSAGRLSHPNIVTIFDVGETEELAYIAMEYLPGLTLRDVMNNGPMPLDLALDTTLQMAEALAFAHEHGVIHRDVKPANVVVTGRNGRIKLTDFGIAHLTNSGHTLAGQMLGSPRYMSPEQAMGREVDGRSDIFSLGAVLYEMLTGQYSFDGDSLPSIVYRVIHESPAPASTLRANLRTELVDLLTRMLHKDPHARPDARTLVNDLHTLAANMARKPEILPSNKVSRLLPVLAFGTPFGVFVLIGLGIIVIEHFIEKPPQAIQTTQKTRTSNVSATAVSTPPIEATLPDTTTGLKQSNTIKADAYLIGLDKKLVELRIKRTELLLEYTEQYPDVVQVDRQLEQLQEERQKHVRKLQKNQKN